MVKKMIGIAVVILIAFCSFRLIFRNNPHGIPNGKYVNLEAPRDNFTLYRRGMKNDDYFLRIKGNKAVWYASNQVSSTDKIIQENGKVYFERGTRRIEVEYDKDTKTIKLFFMNQD